MHQVRIPPGGTQVGDDVYLYKIRDKRFYYHVSGVWMKSVTSVTRCYPSGEGLLRWQCSHGSYEAMQQALQKAAYRGTDVHRAVEVLLRDKRLSKQGWSDEIWAHCMAFMNWYRDVQPEVIGTEKLVFDVRRRLAGTLDLLCRIDGKIVVCDLKSGSGVYDNMRLQVNEYGWLAKAEKVGILRTNSRHKRKYEWIEWDLDEELHKIFVHLHFVAHHFDSQVEPVFPRELPTELSI